LFREKKISLPPRSAGHTRAKFDALVVAELAKANAARTATEARAEVRHCVVALLGFNDLVVN
jgi:hypothetical protein